MAQKNIVVGADFSETGDQAIRVGLQQLASGVAHGMYVVYALAMDEDEHPRDEASADPDAHTVTMVAQSLARRISAVALRERLPYHPDLVRVEIRKGEVRAALLASASLHHADLIIVGTHGRQGLSRLLVGSVAETLVRAAECSVLVARPVRTAIRRLELGEDPRTEAYALTPSPSDEDDGDPQRGELAWRPMQEAPR